MIKAFDSYSLVAGSHGRQGSIWRGPDHLLIVEGGGLPLLPLSESYRRIDYQNIQVLGMVRTYRYVWLAIILAVPIALLGLAFYASLDAEQAGALSLLSGIPFCLTLILLLVHLMRGPTCRCTLQTQVLSLRLRPLKRVRQATKVLSAIEQMCLEHQGEMPMPMDLDASAASSHPTGFRPMGVKPAWGGSNWLLAAGSILGLWGAFVAGELFVAGVLYSVLNVILGVVAFTLLIIAFVRVCRYQAPAGLKAIIISSLVLQGLIGLGVYAALIAVEIAKGIRQSSGTTGANVEADALFMRFANTTFDEMGAAGWAPVALGVIMAGLGIAMIPFGSRRKAAQAGAEATPPPQSPQAS